jgi:hypothetical protein
VRSGMLMKENLWFGVWMLAMLCAVIGYTLSLAHAQTPPTIVQLTNGYPPAFILYWQVGTTPPACNVTQQNGSPGPPLYAMAIQQGPPDTVMVCLNGSAGTPVWVPLVTAP